MIIIIIENGKENYKYPGILEVDTIKKNKKYFILRRTKKTLLKPNSAVGT